MSHYTRLKLSDLSQEGWSLHTNDANVDFIPTGFSFFSLFLIFRGLGEKAFEVFNLLLLLF